MDDLPVAKTNLPKGFLKSTPGNKQLLIAAVLTIVLFIIGEIISPGFAHLTHILMIFKVAAFLGILALAQSLVIIAGGEGLDLSVGAIASMGAVTASVIINGQDANIFSALLVILTVGLVIGFVNGAGISYFNIPPLIMTLAMSSVVNGLIIIYSNGFAVRGSASQLLKEISGKASFNIPNILFVWFAVTLLVCFLLSKTKFGMALYGVGANELTSELSGVRSRRVRTAAYMLSGAVSAFGGLLLLGYTGNAYLDIGSPYVLPSVAAVVIGGISLAGGTGSYLGVVLGAIILKTIGGILVNLHMGEAGRQVVFGLILLALLTVYGRQTANK